MCWDEKDSDSDSCFSRACVENKVIASPPDKRARFGLGRNYGDVKWISYAKDCEKKVKVRRSVGNFHQPDGAGGE